MFLDKQTVDSIAQALKQFHADNLMSEAWRALYDKAPIEQMIPDFLTALNNPQHISHASENLSREALEHQLPYPLIMGDINYLKSAIVAYFRKQGEQPLELFDRVDAIFDQVKNEVACHYLDEAVSQNGIFPKKSKIEDQKLLSIYNRWFHGVREAIQSHQIEQFLTLSTINQEIFEALTYPETLMVCLDDGSCKDVKERHQNLMRLMGLLFEKLQAQSYEQAYLLYHELRVAVEQLVTLLVTLYFNFETNPLSSFLRFLELVPSLGKQAYLVMINARNLERTNQLYGEDVGDLVLESIEEALDRLKTEHQSSIVAVKGVNGDFYLLSLGLERQALSDLLSEFVDHLLALDTQIEMTPEVSMVTVEYSGLKFVGRQNFRRLFRYLHETKANSNLFIEGEALEALNQWILDQVATADNIKQLLVEKNLVLHVQPIVSVQHPHAYYAFEVLGRLQTPDGLLSAGIFIDSLIQMKLIDVFDGLVLEKIIEKKEQLKHLAGRVFLNVSPASLKSRHYLDKLVAALKGPLKDLEVVLELTEQTFLEQNRVVENIHQAHGAHFAIDDFGSGYSALSMVADLAELGVIKVLKVDGSITQLTTTKAAYRNILEVIGDLTDKLALKSIAEFIEDEETLQAVVQSNIDFGQGYYLGRPDSIEKWLAKVAFNL